MVQCKSFPTSERWFFQEKSTGPSLGYRNIILATLIAFSFVSALEKDKQWKAKGILVLPSSMSYPYDIYDVLKLSLMYLQYSQNNELIQCTNIHHSTAKISPSKSNGSVKIVFLLLLQSICAHHQWKKIRLDLFKHCFSSSYLPFWLQVPMPRFTNSETCVKTCIIKWAENLPGNVVESRIRICH